MKAHYKTQSGRIVFEVEGTTPKEIFAAIAHVQALFEADTACGCCGSIAIQFRLRVASDDSEFYELYCPDCRAALSFGQNRTGGGHAQGIAQALKAHMECAKICQTIRIYRSKIGL